ncbi:MAG: TIGR04211 family SH3 domain-containing protein [Deltaproteobacteria bacterium]|nr:TIGR04211 family SH3 domain-containing protein [Deltaproteobacteria bacterium]
MKTFKLLWLLVLIVFLPFPALGQYKAYVTDYFEISCRTGPGTDYRIIKLLHSGDAVEFLSEAEGWTQVRLENGDVGWVLSRYLMRDKPLSLQADSLIKENAALKEEKAGYLDQLEKLRSENSGLQTELANTAASVETVKLQLGSLEEGCKEYVSLKDRYAKLKTRHEELEKEYSVLHREGDESLQKHLWMVYGGGILLVGVVVGSLFRIARTSKRKRHYLRV